MRKKIMMLPVVLLFLFVVSASNLYAANVECSTATIKKVGSNPTATEPGVSPFMARLDCSDDTLWEGTLTFFLSEDLGEAGLATLLTAYSLGKTVWVRTLGNTQGSVVTVILVND